MQMAPPNALAPQATCPRLLVINPNTSEAVAQLLQKHVGQQWAQLHDLPAASSIAPVVETISAPFGASYIASELAYTIASHACIDAWATAVQQQQTRTAWSGILIGCFGDPGLLALREIASLPTSGLAEGAFVTAAKLGKFGIVTGGRSWKPMLERLAQALHFEHALAAISTVPLTGAQLMADRQSALKILRKACQEMEQTHSVQSIIIGGAALAGMAAEIQPHVTVPLIDSVQAATSHMHAIIQQSHAPHTTGTPTLGEWMGLSPALSALLENRN